MPPWIRITLPLIIASGGLFWVWQSGLSIERGASTDPAPALCVQGAVTVAPQQRERSANATAPAVGSVAVPGRATGVASSCESPLVFRAVQPMEAAEIEFRKTLQPRTFPPKAPLIIPPGNDLRLLVKPADALLARATADGRLELEASSAVQVQGLAALAWELNLRFRRVHTVSDEALHALERRAAERTLVAQPDLGGLIEAVVPGAARDRIVVVAQALHALPEIEYVELASVDRPPPPPAADLAPTTPLLSEHQTYRGAANGINVDHVWDTFGIRGHPSLRLTDCEYLFNANHEDLAGLVQLQPGVVSMYTGYGDDHGTAVAGILFAGVNNYGMTGCVPDCVGRFFPEYAMMATGLQLRAACVTAAVATSAPGDIVMLEMQDYGAQGNLGPAEYDLSVFNAVKTGSDAGVIVIAAAGNGAENLDDPAYSTYHARGDSGAILVGAGTTTQGRQSFSTYGTRVNLQGWGGGVATTGYGDLATYGGDPDQSYTTGFEGTSSATPIAASAAALLQSFAIAVCERRLGPAEMRSLLASTGRPQTGDLTKTIGPLPELQAAIQALLIAYPPTFSSLRSWCVFHFGNPEPALDGDSDRDGVADLLEYVIGTDPKIAGTGEAARLPSLSVRLGPGNTRVFVFEFHNHPSRTGAVWKVQCSESLATGLWRDVMIGEGGVTATRDGEICRVSIPTEAEVSARFFRLRVTAR